MTFLLVAGALVLAVAAIPVVAIVGPMLVRPSGRVPGYGTRTKDSPYAAEDIARLLDNLQAHWPGADLSPTLRATLKTRLDRLDIYYRPEASWRTETGERVAGLNRQPHRIEVGTGKTTLRQGATAHEAAHDLCRELFRDADTGHTRAAVWRAVDRARGLA